MSNRHLRVTLVAAATLLSSAAVVPVSSAEDETQACNANGQTVAYGDVLAGCTIEVIADLDVFQFNASAGDLVRLAVGWTSGTGAPCVELRDPASGLVAGPACGFNVAFSPGPLAMSGTYQVIVTDSQNNQTLTFNLALERLLPLRGPTAMAFGEVVTGREIRPITDVDTFSFDGSAGSEIRILVSWTSGTGAPCVEVRAPGDTSPPATPACGFNIDLPMSLTASGTYQIVVTDSVNNQTLAYNISLNCINGPCGHRPPTCFVTPAMVGTTLNLNVTLGAGEAAQWHAALAALGTTFRLWSVPVPATEPPFSGTFGIPGFPSLGRVALLSTLTTAAGIICSDLETIDTGAPASPTSVADVERVLRR